MSALLTAFSDLMGSFALLLAVIFICWHGRAIGQNLLKVVQLLAIVATKDNDVRLFNTLRMLLIDRDQPPFLPRRNRAKERRRRRNQK